MSPVLPRGCAHMRVHLVCLCVCAAAQGPDFAVPLRCPKSTALASRTGASAPADRQTWRQGGWRAEKERDREREGGGGAPVCAVRRTSASTIAVAAGLLESARLPRGPGAQCVGAVGGREAVLQTWQAGRPGAVDRDRGTSQQGLAPATLLC